MIVKIIRPRAKMGILSKGQKSTEKLIQENDELKNKLHTVLDKYSSLEELEEKLTQSRRELSETNQK